MKLPVKIGGGGTLKRVNIGSSNSHAARTFNVASVLPNVYKNLTINNFAVSVTSCTYYTQSGGTSYNNTIPSSYNASTGVLTCNKCDAVSNPYQGGAYCNYTVVCFYVE